MMCPHSLFSESRSALQAAEIGMSSHVESINNAKSRLEGELLSHRSEISEARRILVEILVEVHPESLKPQSDGHTSMSTLLHRLQQVLRESVLTSRRRDNGADSLLKSEFIAALLREVETTLDRLESDDQAIWERSFVDLATLRKNSQITLGSIRQAARQLDALSEVSNGISTEQGADSHNKAPVLGIFQSITELLMNDRKALSDEIAKLKEMRAASSSLSMSQRSGIQTE